MKIFLSYAHEQVRTAEAIAVALRGEGHAVFFDRHDLKPGEEYNAHIREQIRTSALLVFLVTKDALVDGSYTLTELAVLQAKWPKPSGRVLPVLLDASDVEELPPYLRAVTILRPEGNVEAEVAAAVETLRKRREAIKRRVLACCVGVALLALGAGRFAYGNTVPERQKAFARHPTVAWLAKQEIPVWAVPADATTVAKLTFFEVSSFEAARASPNKIASFVASTQPDFWSLLVSLDTRAAGPIVVSGAPDNLMMVLLLDCSTVDPGPALKAAGLDAIRNQAGATPLYRVKFGNAERTIALVDTNSVPPTALQNRTWKYSRALMAGDRKQVELAIARINSKQLSVPGLLNRAADVAGTENWVISSAFPTKPEDELTKDALQVVGAGLERTVAWTRGLSPSELAKVSGDPTRSFPDLMVSAQLEYGSPEQSAKVAAWAKSKFVKLGALDSDSCELDFLRMAAAAQPALLALAMSAAESIAVKVEHANVMLHFESRRLVLENEKFAASTATVRAWTQHCAARGRARPLIAAVPDLAARIAADITRPSGDPTVDAKLVSELKNVEDPAPLLAPFLNAELRDNYRAQRVSQYVAATLDHPRQVAGWITSGVPLLLSLGSTIEPTGALTKNSVALLGAVIVPLLEPGMLEPVIDELAVSRAAPPILAMVLSTALCNTDPRFQRDELWPALVNRLQTKDYQKTPVAGGVVLATAACVASAPERWLDDRLKPSWSALPSWFRKGLPAAIRQQLPPNRREHFRTLVAKLPFSDMKTALTPVAAK